MWSKIKYGHIRQQCSNYTFILKLDLKKCNNALFVMLEKQFKKTIDVTETDISKIYID